MNKPKEQWTEQEWFDYICDNTHEYARPEVMTPGEVFGKIHGFINQAATIACATKFGDMDMVMRARRAMHDAMVDAINGDKNNDKN